MPTRREALIGVAGISLAASAAHGRADLHPASAGQLTRIAFGSCAKQTKPQPIWETVLAAQPDLFIFLGDNVYIDSRNIAEYQKAYDELAAKPGFRKLRATTPIIAIWDDHDFGDDDQDQTFPLKLQSRDIFLNFWNEPATSPRWSRDGVYASYLFGPEGKRVQIILPDLRTNKTPNIKRDLGIPYKKWALALEKAGKPVPGPYARDPDRMATQIGETQWRWLEEQLRVPANIRIFGSSLQVLADFPGWEEWINYAHDHARLIETIRKTEARGLFFISGDTHYGEISTLKVNVPYPLWDFTSSGLTEVWPVEPPNANRVGQIVREQNFGLIKIDWTASPASVTVTIRTVDGTAKLEKRLTLDMLA
jgi:alkaline phosphatase D